MTGARLRAALAAYPRPFWMLVVGTFVNRTGLVVLPFLALYLSGPRGFSVAQATVAVSLYGAGAFSGGFVGGWLSDRVGRRPVLLASLGGAALPMAAIPFAPSFAAVAGVVFAFGLLSEMYRPAVSAAVADLVPEARRPRAYAIVYWAINLGSAVGPAVGGLLAERSYLGLFVLEGASLLAYASSCGPRSPRRGPRPPTARRVPGSTCGRSRATGRSRRWPRPCSWSASGSTSCSRRCRWRWRPTG